MTAGFGGKRGWPPVVASVLAVLWGCSVNVEPADADDGGAKGASSTDDETTTAKGTKSSNPPPDTSEAPSSDTSSNVNTDTSSEPSSSLVETTTSTLLTSGEVSSTSSASETSSTPTTDEETEPVFPCVFEREDLGELLASSAADDGGSQPDASLTDTLDAALSDAGYELPDADPLDAGASSVGASDPLPHPSLRGWATVADYGLETTTGGAAGALVIARSAAELVAYAADPAPLVIAVCGRLRAPALTITSNKTLVGIGPNARVEGGLHIQGEENDYVSNVIVTNLEIVADESDVLGYGIRLEYAHHVWLDHLTIVDSREGAIDIVHGSDLITVSWTHMYHSEQTAAQARRFGARVGDTDDDSVLERDGGRLRVTFHHNHWGERLRQRMPRIAYGQVHLVNNYYAPMGGDYAIWGTWRQASIRLERNAFYSTSNPHMLHNAGLNLFPDEADQALLLANGNLYVNTDGVQESNGTAFTPPYSFETDNPAELASIVSEGAGPRWPL